MKFGGEHVSGGHWGYEFKALEGGREELSIFIPAGTTDGARARHFTPGVVALHIFSSSGSSWVPNNPPVVMIDHRWSGEALPQADVVAIRIADGAPRSERSPKPVFMVVEGVTALTVARATWDDLYDRSTRQAEGVIVKVASNQSVLTGEDARERWAELLARQARADAELTIARLALQGKIMPSRQAEARKAAIAQNATPPDYSDLK